MQGWQELPCVVARRELIEKESSKTPIILRYKTHLDKNSLYNTPPVFAIYTLNLILNWIKSIGGVDEVHRRNQQKAKLLYDTIDSSGGFYVGHADKSSRSLMNVTFNIKNGDGLTTQSLKLNLLRRLLS